MKNIQKNHMLEDSVYLSIRSISILFIAFIVAIGCLFWSPNTEAGAWVSVGTKSGGQYQGEYSWPSEESDEVICLGSYCSVAICHFSTEKSELCINPTSTTTTVTIAPNTTAKEARDIFVKRNGVSGRWSTTTGSLKAPDTCFGVMYWQGTNNSNFTGKVMSGSYCGGVPPPYTQCELMGDVVFDYGSLSAGVVQGATKTEYINVQCSASADVKITLVEENTIMLGGGIASKLFINDKDLSTGASISISKGSQSVPITSTLSSATKPTAGNYSGSGVIVLGYE